MEKVKSKVVEVAREAKKLAKDDPRRVVHSLKVGFAVASVSSFYYYQPLYDNFGVSTMWAIMTVVVVFEFSVAAISTFIRFFPKIKVRYDYGFMILILTFSLISISGFRDGEIIELARNRLSTVIMGGAACVIISIFVCPVWAGEDLHKLTANNLDKLGKFLEGFGDEYFIASNDIKPKDGSKKPNLEGYKSVLNTKNNEESLANYARWEPYHGQFRFRHPWKQYLAVGAVARQCAYRLDALNAYLNAEIQTSPEIKNTVQEPFRKISSESGKALMELSKAIKTMTKPSSSNSHIKNSQSAVRALNSILKSDIWRDTEPLEVIFVAAVASLLTDVVNLVEKISKSVFELALAAHFKDTIEPTVSLEKPMNKIEPIVHKTSDLSKKPGEGKCEKSETESCPHVLITIDRDEESEQNPLSHKSKDNLLHEISMSQDLLVEGKCEGIELGRTLHVVITVEGSCPKIEENVDIETRSVSSVSNGVKM